MPAFSKGTDRQTDGRLERERPGIQEGAWHLPHFLMETSKEENDGGFSHQGLVLVMGVVAG